jgi:hypothetical protein
MNRFPNEVNQEPKWRAQRLAGETFLKGKTNSKG